MRRFPFAKTILRTNDVVQDEIFASLYFLSEVKSAGFALLRKHHQTSDVNKSFRLFQSFVRQAKTFYESSSALHHRASSLNYYYSFMNLAKAFISIHDPNFLGSGVTHGLRHKFSSGKFSTQYVTTQQNGVFTKLYNMVIGSTIKPSTKLNVTTLLGYCTDIGVEYMATQKQTVRNLPCRLAIIVNGQKAFALMAMDGFDVIAPYSRFMNSFGKVMEQVNVPIGSSREVFGIGAETHVWHQFFETRKEFPLVNGRIPHKQILDEVEKALGPHVTENPYSDPVDFFITLPYRKTLQIPMNELLADYCLIFYLGSLVRYNPWYLDKLLYSNEGLLIERFMKAAPISLLRYMHNQIMGDNLVYASR